MKERDQAEAANREQAGNTGTVREEMSRNSPEQGSPDVPVGYEQTAGDVEWATFVASVAQGPTTGPATGADVQSAGAS